MSKLRIDVFTCMFQNSKVVVKTMNRKQGYLYAINADGIWLKSEHVSSEKLDERMTLIAEEWSSSSLRQWVEGGMVRNLWV